MPVGLGHLMPKPGIKSVRRSGVGNDHVDAIGPVMIVNEPVDLLLKQDVSAVHEPGELPPTEPVDCEANGVSPTQLGNLLLVALAEWTTAGLR